MSYRKATIRPYRAEDESLLFSLAREALGSLVALTDRAPLWGLVVYTVLVPSLAGYRAGYVALTQLGDVVRIDQLLVSPRHEHEGIGRQLVDYAEGFAISEGAISLQIVVEPANLRARDFYARRSFVQAGDDVLELPLPQR